MNQPNFNIPKQSQIQKMIFIMNALDQGWSIKKTKDSYIFTNKHENRKEIFMEHYLEKFVGDNLDGFFS